VSQAEEDEEEEEENDAEKARMGRTCGCRNTEISATSRSISSSCAADATSSLFTAQTDVKSGEESVAVAAAVAAVGADVAVEVKPPTPRYQVARGEEPMMFDAQKPGGSSLKSEDGREKDRYKSMSRSNLINILT